MQRFAPMSAPTLRAVPARAVKSRWTPLRAAALASTLVAALPAGAAVTEFSGKDEGVGPGVSPSSPNSSVAQAAFLSAAEQFGPVLTDYLDAAPLGYAPSFRIAAAQVTLTGPNGGPGFSGITDQDHSGSSGPVFGFSTVESATDNGRWLGFPGGTATFVLDAPSHSFGFYATGLQTALGLDFTVSFDGASATTLHPLINVDGGISFFGFTSDDPFTTVIISRPTNYPLADAWGVDGISVNAVPAVVPEPSTWLLMLAGLGLLLLPAQWTGSRGKLGA